MEKRKIIDKKKNDKYLLYSGGTSFQIPFFINLSCIFMKWDKNLIDWHVMTYVILNFSSFILVCIRVYDYINVNNCCRRFKWLYCATIGKDQLAWIIHIIGLFAKKILLVKIIFDNFLPNNWDSIIRLFGKLCSLIDMEIITWFSSTPSLPLSLRSLAFLWLLSIHCVFALYRSRSLWCSLSEVYPSLALSRDLALSLSRYSLRKLKANPRFHWGLFYVYIVVLICFYLYTFGLSTSVW